MKKFLEVLMDDDGLLQTMDMPKGSMQLIDGAGRSRVAAQLAVMDSQKASGGSAANTIKALANMGVESAFIGKVGDDADGRFYGEDLEREVSLPVCPSCKDRVRVWLPR